MEEQTTNKPLKRHFKIEHLPELLVTTVKSWFQSAPFQKSAIVAYYARRTH